MEATLRPHFASLQTASNSTERARAGRGSPGGRGKPPDDHPSPVKWKCQEPCQRPPLLSAEERPQKLRTHHVAQPQGQPVRGGGAGGAGMDCRCCGQGHRRPSVPGPCGGGTLPSPQLSPGSPAELTPARLTRGEQTPRAQQRGEVAWHWKRAGLRRGICSEMFELLTSGAVVPFPGLFSPLEKWGANQEREGIEPGLEAA